MQKLSFDPTWIKTGIVSAPGSVLYLHDIENALSAFLAASFSGWVNFLCDYCVSILTWFFVDQRVTSSSAH
jgi:hypothetical protein